ncbi:MAG: DNA-binding protein [Methyloprofundus sp.]|nr:DNA-binding protein [Methyloprofundus sp.]
MAQSKILIDTNAYLRLAQTVRPLLFVPFGDNEYCLYIIPELNEELKSRRLTTKFPWIDEKEYLQNRQHTPSLSKKQRNSIKQTFEYLWGYVQTELPGPSKVDALYIAYALELSVPVITDDQDMTELAHAFDAQVMPTLELLKLMLDCGYLDKKTIDGIVDYWRYICDRPANLEQDYIRLFSK